MLVHRLSGAARSAAATLSRLRALLGAVALLTGGLAVLPTPVSAQTVSRIVVSDDPGGNLADRTREIDRLRRTGQRVEIRRGTCMSACTMYLGLENVCVGPAAVFGFHGPGASVYGLALPRDEFEHWSRVMAAHYPEPLRRWFLRTGRDVTVGFTRISGRQLIAMGVPACA